MKSQRFVAAILVLGSVLCLSCVKATKQPHQGAAKLTGDQGAEGEREWFLNQRRYPFDSIPENARQLAWEGSVHRSLKAVSATDTRIWRSIGPTPTVDIRPGFPKEWQINSGRINAIAISPADSQVILVGSATGGIWRSIDGGANFVPVTDNQIALAIGSLAFSRSNPAIVYAGTGDGNGGYTGNGVLKSTDGGATWTRIDMQGLPGILITTKIEVEPTNPNRVYLALKYQAQDHYNFQVGGLYLSTDGGVSWTNLFPSVSFDLVIHPVDSKTIYLADGGRGLVRSTDAGITWTLILAVGNNPDNIKVAVSPSDPSKIIVFTQNYGDSNPRVIVSSDGGASWNAKDAKNVYPSQFWYNSVVAVDPSDPSTLHVGTTDLFKSTDGGTSWSNENQPFPKVHPDQHAFAYSPQDPNVIYAGNDGGLWKSTDRGASFTSLNHTLSLTQFYHLAVGPTDPLLVYGGTQDNGTQVRLSGGSTDWTWFSGGDGGYCVVDPQNPDVVFTTTQSAEIDRWKDKGFTQYITGSNINNAVAWPAKLGDPFPTRVAFLPPLVGNGVDATLYFGTWRLYVGTDLGDTWSAPAGLTDLTKGVDPAFGADVLAVIAVARSDNRVIYTGSFQGRAMESTDGGKNWSDISSGLPDRSIKSITITSSDANVAYLTVSGFGSGHVFKTTSLGANWTDISGDLPDIPTNALLIDPLNDGILYAGTDIGVFRSMNGGVNWEVFNNGMPPAIVNAFAAQSTGLVCVGTYGRGAYELRDPALDPIITSAAFDGGKNLAIGGSKFGGSPTVLVNDTNANEFIRGSSDTSIKLKGKAKNLGLKTGANTIQVIDSTGATSNKFVLQL
jgi:photosystem II stability/assembly factor-like uncharacterized protein